MAVKPSTRKRQNGWGVAIADWRGVGLETITLAYVVVKTYQADQKGSDARRAMIDERRRTRQYVERLGQAQRSR